MTLRFALIALALAAAGCDRQASAPVDAGAAPQLDAPAPESQPSRVFAATNDAARAVANEITISVTQQLPDAADADIKAVLSLRDGAGLNVEGEVTGAISPATQVEGQTLRALLAIPIEEPQVLVYRVTQAAGSPGLCSSGTAEYIVLWEPSGPGDASLKLLGIVGAAPGAGGARACEMLAFRRS